jgi:hypothetical protein
VGPLVDKVNVVQRRLRKERGEGEDEDEDETEKGKGILLKGKVKSEK